MGLFLPEPQASASDPKVDFTPPAGDASGDVALMQRIFSAAVQNPSLIPPNFMAYVVDFIQTQRLNIPIGQVVGYTQTRAQQARVSTSETTPASVAYVDLTTVGPKLDGLGDGQYIFWFGALNNQGAGASSFMGLKINGTEADDANAVQWITNGSFIPGATAISARLSSGGPNTVTARYRTSVAATPATFANRWLIAQKIANA